MSMNIEDMSPNQIIKAIRARDMRTIKILVKDGVSRGIWTQAEVAEMVDVNPSTVTRWIHND